MYDNILMYVREDTCRDSSVGHHACNQTCKGTTESAHAHRLRSKGARCNNVSFVP